MPRAKRIDRGIQLKCCICGLRSHEITMIGYVDGQFLRDARGAYAGAPVCALNDECQDALVARIRERRAA